jgi:enoyl-CoA hydratase/carnithine racemase
MEYEMFRRNIRTHDAKEGIKAFLENRKPVFSAKVL